MFFTKPGHFPLLVALTTLAMLISTGGVRAQRRGRSLSGSQQCMQRQLTGQQSSLRALQYGSLPFTPQPYGSQAQLQQYALQQALLQAQLNALQQYAFIAQTLGPDAAQLPLNDLLQALSSSPQLTPAQLQQLRQQQAALAKQLGTAQNNNRR